VPVSDAAAVDEFRLLAQREAGLVLAQNKAYLVTHRLAPVCDELGVELGELARRARSDTALARRCVEELLTYESFWFRDRKPFDAVSQLWDSHGGPGPFKVLSLACSTGQEPYSLALMATERWGALAGSQLSVLAADISTRALERAREGLYSQTEVARGLPAAMLARHFHRRGSRWELDASVRRLVEFRRVDLRAGVPVTLGGWDLVLCRNVLIYMDADTRERAVAAIARQLSVGGHLMLGSGEPSAAGPQWSARRVAEVRCFRREQ